jgi:hypothetical protein
MDDVQLYNRWVRRTFVNQLHLKLLVRRTLSDKINLLDGIN